jgi:anti-anti-sigma regulatory factor
MLKISYDSDSSLARQVLRLEGQIAGRWVAELRRVYDERRDNSHPLTIDLKDVTFIDRSGVAFFADVYPEVVLVNCSLFAAEQLKPVIERQETV